MPSTQKYLLDTNVIVRLVAADHSDHGARCVRLLESAARGECVLLLRLWVAAEAVHVLTSFYKADRQEVATRLLEVLELPGVDVEEPETLTDALRRFAAKRVDFIDALAAASAAAGGFPVASFDRDLDKFEDITRYEPR